MRRISRHVDLTHAHDAYSHTLAALMSAAPFVVSRRVGFPVAVRLSRWKYGRARRFIAVSNYVKGVLDRQRSGGGADHRGVRWSSFAAFRHPGATGRGAGVGRPAKGDRARS